MAIKRIQAFLECDGCGKDYQCDLDPATNLSAYLDLAAYIEHGLADVVGEHMLCPTCLHKVITKLEDEEVEDPTYDQVHRVLKIAA